MDVQIREITVIPTLMHWHREVIENVFGAIPSKRQLVTIRRYYLKHIADGSYFAIVADIDGNYAGYGAIYINDIPPSPTNPSGRYACLDNIYVRKEYRRRGIAHSIVRYLIKKAVALGYTKLYISTPIRDETFLKSFKS